MMIFMQPNHLITNCHVSVLKKNHTLNGYKSNSPARLIGYAVKYIQVCTSITCLFQSVKWALLSAFNAKKRNNYHCSCYCGT